MREFNDYDVGYIEEYCIEKSSISVAGTAVGRNLSNIEGLSTEDTSINEGSIFYDILFKVHFPDDKGDVVAMYINIEAQKSYYMEYSIEKRAMYYAYRCLSSQFKYVNKGSRYDELEKVYSIWLCIGDVPDKDAGKVYVCRMAKEDIIGDNNYSKDYDLIELVFVKLNDKVELEDKTLQLIQTLSSDIRTKEEKLERLEELEIKLEDEIREEVATMCNLSDLIVERGLRMGREEGVRELKRMLALKLLSSGQSYKEIASFLELSMKELTEVLSS